MYKAVAFDFFGVIQNDQYTVWLSNHGFKKQGEFSDLSIAADKDFIEMKDFYEGLSKLSRIPAIEIKAEFDKPQHLDEAVIKIIKKIREKYKTALASNSNSDYLIEMLQRNKLDDLFDEVIISGEVGYSKPSAEFFEYLLKKLDLLPSQVVFIDDTPQNVVSAEALGIKSIGFTDALALKDDLIGLGLKF
jgi:putative hydrolase of the HAD superfamily